MAGLHLDPWQAFVLRESLGERADGTWAALEVGVEVSRQNGKGGVLEARELAGLFLLEEELQIHSAHEFSTSLEALRRLRTLIEETPDFDREVLKMKESHGEEGIELRGNRRIRFRTRTKGGGRGLSGDTVYLDEAMIIKESMHGTLFPIMSARDNPQIWYTGSAVNQEEHDDGVVFARIRERGLAGGDHRLAWFSWGWSGPKPGAEGDEADKEMLPEDADELLDDQEFWAGSNPGLGIRIDSEFVKAERRSLSIRNFAVERLGIGDWPDTSQDHSREGINKENWEAREDPGSVALDPVCFAFDVSPDRSTASISSAGLRGDGKYHVELIERKSGTLWIVDRLAELERDHRPTEIVCDERSPAASLLKRLKKRRVQVNPVNGSEYAQGCQDFYDAIEEDDLRHIGQPELTTAALGAAKRPLGDAWAWSRTRSEVDITPLASSSLALRAALQGAGESVYNDRDLLVLD